MEVSEEVGKSLQEFVKHENLTGKTAEVDAVLCDLVDKHEAGEGSLKRVLLCVYQLLDTYNENQVKFGKNLFHKLTALLTKRQSCSIAVLILSCIKIYVRKFPKQQGQYLIEELWCLSTTNEQQPHASLILIQMFDCFVDVIDGFLYADELHNVTRQLLVSELLEERKAGYNIMQQILAAIEKRNDDTKQNVFGWPDKQQFLQSWSIYISIWEQLESTPAAVELDSLKDLQCNDNLQWQIWLNFLQKTLLSHDNISVSRKALNYFMENYNFAELSESMQRQFLLAANNVELYNVDVFTMWADSNGKLSNKLAFVVDEKYTTNFLKESKVSFFEALVSIQWKPVPLHFWLTRLTSEKSKRPIISKELLIRLAAVVKQMENRRLRKTLRRRLFWYFKKAIAVLNLPDYIEFCEALYNIEDGYYNHYNFWLKVKRTESLDDGFLCVSKRFYQIWSNRFKRYRDFLILAYPIYFDDMFEYMLDRLAKLPKEQHGWLRFFIVFDAEHTDRTIEFCRSQYDLDLERLRKESVSLNEFCKEIDNKLVWHPKEEADFIRKKCVDLYVEQRLRKWSALDELGLNPIKLLSMGTYRTFGVLTELLKNPETRLSSNVLSSMIETLKRSYLGRNDVCEYFVCHVFKYANRNMTESEFESITCDVLNIDQMDAELAFQVARFAKFNKTTFLRGLLHGEPTTGIKRIEEAYADCFVDRFSPTILRLRVAFKWRSDVYVDETIYDELLRINKELTRRCPFYHQNSKIHRLKIRIAMAIYEIHYQMRWPYWTNELWDVLLTDYDHESIRYLYEVMIVLFAPDLEMLLEKLKSATHYPASQQVSLMAVVFFYCMFNWDKLSTPQRHFALVALESFTKSVDFETRLNAQLFSYGLILKAEEDGFALPDEFNIKKSVEDTFGNDLAVLHPRFKIIECHKNQPTSINDVILFITNAPFDETEYWRLHDILDKKLHHGLDKACKAFKKRAATKQVTQITAADDINLDFGVYESNMKPFEEIIFGNKEAKSYPDEEGEIFVVANLIEKLPNLVDIARTCEVLGVKNLVVNSKLHIEKKDFDDSNMTAEQSLNILEIAPADLDGFLIQKQIEGFKIVGAEPIANSVSFADFQFPAKCVLLLGHEKHGIPAHLLGFLDYAVEIPQFGQVRSLNVHVTGALFMWEYCKQQSLTKS